jgi:uncharacterized protein YbjT (DUF2867 family)
MKVFVTGATGFVGEEVLRHLFTAGYSIRILARNSNSPRVRAAISRHGVEVHPGDVLEPGSLQDALDGVQAVIHLVGIISEAGRSTYENVHTRGTQNLVQVTHQSGAKRFIHMSALGTRPNARARYHQSKWAAEEIVRQSGLDFTIFRPSLIYGPHDGFVNLFAKIVRCSPVVPVLGGGRTKFQPVSVQTVAAAFVKSITQPKSSGQTYDLCGPQTFTLPEMLDQILRVMERKRVKLRVPSPLARLQAGLLEFFFACLLRKPPPLNRDQLLMLQEDNVGDARPANELFGLASLEFKEGIAYVNRNA